MQDRFKQQAEHLVQQMDILEMFSQLRHDSPAIPRLGIPAYNWWNEGLHGSARSGTATVFPQAIGLASLFDPDFLHAVATVISTEQRARYNISSLLDDRDIYKGLSIWSPNVNIFRDPRWGRGQETYGEDPYLTTRLAVAFITGLQGEGEILKTASCVKHLIAHSGPEPERHGFNAMVTKKDLSETYQVAFEAAVKEAKVDAVMGAYSAINGEPCCGSKTLIEGLLRESWGFSGMYISDCWAIKDFHLSHKVTSNAEESVALALNAGCDLNCGCEYKVLEQAYNSGLISYERIVEATVRVVTTRCRLGLFAKETPFDSLGVEDIDSEEHALLAYEASCRSLVLLKNENLLPLEASDLSSIAIIGPNANSRPALWGNYHGTASRYVTVLEGVRSVVGAKVKVRYSEGCSLVKPSVERLGREGDRLSEAVAFAQASDVTVLCLGLDESVEGEMHDDGNGGWAGDKSDLRLPLPQRKLLEAVASTGKPIILILLSGGSLDPEIERFSNVRALIQGWYPGQEGGLALARLIFGHFSPSGRLPVTFYRATAELPPFTDYSMHSRTYRYCNEEDVLYPFGFGLSYTCFAYSDAHAFVDEEGMVQLSCIVQNRGKRAGREVVQLYCKTEDANFPLHPVLCGTKDRFLEPEERESLHFVLPPSLFCVIGEDGQKQDKPGSWQLFVGGSQPDTKSFALGGAKGVVCTITRT
ncbi:glycoside hydrolase family 3 C-terminal domain-containing protein [Sphaerochaeta sp. PS]|uniref:glycoside hydrolase family 3 C-terminal domain-containing protein n=1 Tax=Sphaerochaeta sp. PS TaxID=3076336 RepID=UPI0028A4CE98|nr:glycoside hydrolase family 3 C-terminal domain-containing protein [Sphaerochaeta sp. PS]MDT4762704.1 glycoside hydrolase family 3 C-terminal domain-containing protein [Sphaerochaeta sp. PS]